jgi:Zn-dependent protease/CBS domain-containing protein
MNKGFSIGKIFGITINIDWSWILIFLLIVWNLAAVFGQFHPDWALSLSWGAAIVAALLFFASVLAHELAHSLVAKAQGVPVRRITLFLFGGVSNIQREPASPLGEFIMAILGPLTSLILGAVLLWIAGSTNIFLGTASGNSVQVMRQLGVVSTMLLWLGSINILLGVFNMTPGFPLDGGRVLRSILWAITGNLQRATRWAAGVGQLIAWLMIVGGIAMIFGVSLPFFGTGFLNGVWLAFIGWFLNSAAEQSYQQTVVQDVLEGVTVERIMRREPPTVAPDISVNTLIHEHIMSADDHAFPVMENSHLLGLITLEDVRKVPSVRRDETAVREVMTPANELVIARPEEEAAEALLDLSRRDVRQLPVMQNDSLVGLLRRRDIVRWLHLREELT